MDYHCAFAKGDLVYLSAPGVSIAFAEWDRPFQTWGMLLLHTTFVPGSFSKEICIGTDPSSLVI
jgi:hypothetical protein